MVFESKDLIESLYELFITEDMSDQAHCAVISNLTDQSGSWIQTFKKEVFIEELCGDATEVLTVSECT